MLKDIYNLTKKHNVGLKDLFLAARADWLKTINPAIIKICQKNQIQLPEVNPELSRLAKELNIQWADYSWHVNNRLVDEDLAIFLELFPEYRGQEKALADYLKDYDLSLLPINLLLQEGVAKFLPKLGYRPASDPYGIQRAHSVITCWHNNDKKYYLATHKPQYATFLVILGGGAGRIYCPIGCRGCYRGEQTRFKDAFKILHDNGRSETVYFPTPIEQIKMLVEAWNERPELQEVYDVLISGGEPLLLNNKTIQEMLNLLRQAKHLHVLRFCTATVFQGLPFRIDNQLITLLKNFQKETGVTMAFNCHISHSEFFTPEAVVAVLKLREAGFDIMAQTPLEEGVNFWANDLNKTIETLRLLDRCFFFIAGRRPYKWITDMQGSISLLSVIRVWQKLHDRHQLESNITKPTACELFLSLPTGNLALSYHSLWALKMQVDKKKKIVQYKIPHAAGNVIEYEEKLMSDINDDPKVLDNLKKFQ